MKELDRLKAKIRTKKGQPPGPDFSRGLSSGCTLVNLALTGKPHVSFLPGHFYLLVGDSRAGKSWLLLQTLAEASINKHYRDYRLIHDNPERGTLMDIPRFFGGKLNERLESPSKNGNSRSLEEFYRNVNAAARAGKPFVYGLDSEDALESEAEREAIESNGKKGSYGTEKAKRNSSGLRLANNDIAESGSLLFIIKQTRQNIGFDAMFNPKTRSGGVALTFYSCAEIWFSIRESIKRTVKGKKRVIGSVLKVHVKKSRMAGRDRSVELIFYPTAGLDEVGSNLRFLLDEGHWTEKHGVIGAPEFKFSGSEEKLIQKIQAEGLERELVLIVTEVWGEIEAACSVQRKSRYD